MVALMYRQSDRGLEVLLVHPGGPFWRNKDDGAWSIPKGEMNENEDAGVAAPREFVEEIGYDFSEWERPVRRAMAFKSSVLAISISSRWAA
jgi:predicted NUDIX family NTP pyrophosphohydrolase